MLLVLGACKISRKFKEVILEMRREEVFLRRSHLLQKISHIRTCPSMCRSLRSATHIENRLVRRLWAHTSSVGSTSHSCSVNTCDSMILCVRCRESTWCSFFMDSESLRSRNPGMTGYGCGPQTLTWQCVAIRIRWIVERTCRSGKLCRLKNHIPSTCMPQRYAGAPGMLKIFPERRLSESVRLYHGIVVA